ncbi:Rne/Rng family ribonuclease [Bifidobacterium sp. UTBIF-78]|uniref:Rne/Rng family ribonuclease n=1 Tax=Bifidobacterium sp. UTBIF-78 TaxID=1465263 RepID=UPI00112C2E2D|nr:Rne/Rng family ribonuclease [Bifidobacterium sp. UTBIF-78]
MQRVARSIVPTDNREGFVNDEADNSTVSNPSSAAGEYAAADTPAPVRRRRGGRRVVRGTGAAGASLELQVQEHSGRAPLFEAPSLTGQSDDRTDKDDSAAAGRAADFDGANDIDDADDVIRAPRRSRVRRAADFEDDEPRSRRRSRRTVDVDDDYEEDRPVRRRTRRSSVDRDGYDDRDSRDDYRGNRSERDGSGHRGTREDSDDERLLDAVDSLPIGHDTVRRAKPMTSLLFQEPVLPAVSRKDERDDQDAENDEDDDHIGNDHIDNTETRSSRRTRRSRTQDEDSRSGGRRNGRSHDSRDDRDDQDADEDRDIRFERDDRNDRDDHGTEDDGAARATRSRRTRRAADRDVRDDRDDRDDQDERAEATGRRANRRRSDDQASDQTPDQTVVDAGSAESGDANDAGDGADTSRRSRRSRRLNAQERRAAAEVEQIEEDLELDDIAYTPITEEEGDEDADGTRTRRRRRRRGSRSEAVVEAEAENGNEREDDEARSRRREDRDRDEEDEEQTVTRRRRRRRSGRNGESADDQGGEQLIRRSRKQQYIDEITDVEGSTRLEAKKQRRRDNRRERSRQSQLMEQDFLARRENVDRLMVVRERDHHTQISVVEDNVLVEHYVSDIQEVQTVGNIYLGRVQNVLPSMEAAFVDIGQARNGVLYAGEVNWDAARLEGQPRRIELAFKSGDPVLVQVTKDPIGHKGARLTSQVTLAGRFLVLVPSGGMTGVSRKLSERERSRLKNIVSKIAPKDMGVIIRTAAEGASEEAIVKDLESLVRQWERINSKREEFWHGRRPKLLQGEPDVAIRVVRDIFNDDFSKLIVEGDKVYDRIEEYLDTMAPDLKDKLEKWDPADHNGKDVFDKWQIDSQLRKGMERQVYLPSGGSIVIDRTEAMTTIDVNTGRFIGRGKSLEETVTRCNLEASEEIARQLRLRDIGGMVMIDYVDMVMPANRDLVLRRLIECLARDRTKHQVAEVTSLGLVQMTRKRIGQGLVEAFSEECPTCKGRGFILHDQPTVSAEYDDPYALRGGDPFVKTNKHGRGTAPAPEPAGSSADVKAKLAQIAAAAVAANNSGDPSAA